MPMPCPLGIRDATALAEDAGDGIDVTFTSLEQPDVLRTRVLDASRQYGPGARRGRAHDGRHGQGHQHGLQLATLPPLTASVTEIPLGATIHLAPIYSDQLAEFRQNTRERVIQVASTACDE